MKKLLKPTILSISLLTVMAGAAISPALGNIRQAFPDASAEAIKMIISMPAMMIILFSLISGKLSFKISKKKILITGLTIYLIGGLGGGFTSGIKQLLIFRAILGIGVGLIMPLSVAIIADFFDGEERTKMIGLSPASSSLGAVIANIVSGILADVNWRFAFAVYTIGLITIMLTIFMLPETRSKAQEKIKKNLPARVYGIAVLQILLMVVFYSVPTSLAIFIHNQGIGNATTSGLVLSVINVLAVIAGLIFSKVLKLLDKFVIPPAIACMGAGFWLLSVSNSITPMIISLALFGFGFGILQPLIYLRVTQLVPKQLNTLAMAVVSSSLYFGQFISPLFIGFVGKIAGDTSIRFSYHFLSIFLALAFFIALLFLYTEKKVK